MKENKSFGQGVIFSLSSYIIWGVLPIYWKSIQGVATFEILANSISLQAAGRRLSKKPRKLSQTGKKQQHWRQRD